MTRVKLCFTLLITIIFAAAALWGNPNVTEAATSPLRITVISKNQLRLVWEDNLDNELGFRIERKIGNGSFTMRAITGVMLQRSLITRLLRKPNIHTG